MNEENKSRVLYLFKEIDNNSIENISHSILNYIIEDNQAEAEKKNFTRKPIRLIINCFGGSVYDMWGLIDIISTSPTPIYTYVTGYAMSAAFMIFISGHKRYIMKNSTIMIHQLSVYSGGKYMDVIEDTNEFTRLHKDMTEFILYKTKINRKTLEKLYKEKKDWYVNSSDAIKLSIADEIVSSIDIK